MMVQESYPADVRSGYSAGRPARTVATLIGAAALVVGAFQHWTTAPRTGDTLTLRALVHTDFAAQTDILKTVGGLSVLLGLLALAGLADRTGWLARLAGCAAVVVFFMFAIELFRSSGESASSTVRHAGTGVWLELGGGVLLLFGSLFGVYRRRRSRSRVGHRRMGTAGMRRARATASTGAREVDENATTVLQPVPESESARERDREHIPDPEPESDTESEPTVASAGAGRGRLPD
jgi:hypothetical protein